MYRFLNSQVGFASGDQAVCFLLAIFIVAHGPCSGVSDFDEMGQVVAGGGFTGDSSITEDQYEHGVHL